jgi:hypothetical protein
MAIRVKDLPDATDSEISGSDEIVIDRLAGTANATISQIRTFVLAKDSSDLETISDDHATRIATVESRFTTDSVKIDNASSGALEIEKTSGRVLPQGDVTVGISSTDAADAVVTFTAVASASYSIQTLEGSTWTEATLLENTTAGTKNVTVTGGVGKDIRVKQTAGEGSVVVNIKGADALDVDGQPVAFERVDALKANSDGTQTIPAFNLNDRAGWHYEESSLKLSIGSTEVLRVGASTYNPRVSAIFQSDVTFSDQALFSAGSYEAPGIAFTGKTDTGIVRDGDAIKLFSTAAGETANGFTSQLASFSPTGLILNKDTTVGNLTGTTIDSAEYKTSKDESGYTFYDGATKKAGLTYSEYDLLGTSEPRVSLDVGGQDFKFEKQGLVSVFSCGSVFADTIGKTTSAGYFNSVRAENVDVHTRLRVMEDGALTDITSRMITSAERTKLAAIDLNELGSGDMTQGFATLRVTTVDGSTQTNLTDIDVDTDTDKRLTLKLDVDEFSATTNNTTNTIDLGLSSKVVTEDNISSKLPSNVLTTSSDIDIDRLPAAVLTTSDTIDADQIQGRAVASTAPNADEVLAWNGSAWAPAATNVDNSSGIRLPASSTGNTAIPALRFGAEATNAEYGLTRTSSEGLVLVSNNVKVMTTKDDLPTFPKEVRVRNYSADSLSLRSMDSNDTGIGLDSNNIALRVDNITNLRVTKENLVVGGGIRRRTRVIVQADNQVASFGPNDNVFIVKSNGYVRLPNPAGQQGLECVIITTTDTSSLTVWGYDRFTQPIDGYRQVVMGPQESLTVITDGYAWYSVGKKSATGSTGSGSGTTSNAGTPAGRWNIALGNRGTVPTNQTDAFPIGTSNDVWNSTGSTPNYLAATKKADGTNSSIVYRASGLGNWAVVGGSYPSDIMGYYLYGGGSASSVKLENVDAGTYDLYVYGSVFPNSQHAAAVIANHSLTHNVYVNSSTSAIAATLLANSTTSKFSAAFNEEGQHYDKVRVTHSGGDIIISPQYRAGVTPVINAITLQLV